MISHTPPGFVRWVKARISPAPLIFILAFITGLGAGACAYALKEMIRHISKWLTAGLDSSWPDWMLVALPVAGIVLTGIFVRYILRHDITHGVSRIIGRLRNKDYTMRTSSIWSPMIASTITLGFGGSAGAEGPIAYVGAGIGSNLARWMQLTPDQMKILLGCGAAAGIAGIFKSPVGGFLFTLEVLRMELVTISVMGVLTGIQGQPHNINIVNRRFRDPLISQIPCTNIHAEFGAWSYTDMDSTRFPAFDFFV